MYFLNIIFETLLNTIFGAPTIFPHEQFSYFHLPKLASSPLHLYENIFALHPYTSTKVRTLVHELKYHKNESACEHIAESLHQGILSLLELYKKIALPDTTHTIKPPEQSLPLPIHIIPIPSSPKRLRERGYNQCDFIAACLVEKLQRTFFENYPRPSVYLHSSGLTRVHETFHQVGLARQDRVKNAQNIFISHLHITDGIIIVIDDVITTGATVRDALRALRATRTQHKNRTYLPPILALSFAH